jgi:hypothetical protein
MVRRERSLFLRLFHVSISGGFDAIPNPKTIIPFIFLIITLNRQQKKKEKKKKDGSEFGWERETSPSLWAPLMPGAPEGASPCE